MTRTEKRRRGEKEKRSGSRWCLAVVQIFVLFLLFNFSVAAQETAPTPEPAKDCAELQKTIDQYAEETARIKLTLSFKTNNGYWEGATTELNYGIERRRIAGNLQSVAFKLGVKRLKDWDVVPQDEKLAYQKKVSQILERERGKSIMADQAALEARLAEIERLLKPVNLRYRDLGCADIPKETGDSAQKEGYARETRETGEKSKNRGRVEHVRSDLPSLNVSAVSALNFA
jgi:hypothetical protein